MLYLSFVEIILSQFLHRNKLKAYKTYCSNNLCFRFFTWLYFQHIRESHSQAMKPACTVLIFGFGSMKRLGVVPFSPPLEVTLTISWYPCIHLVKVKHLAQGHNATAWARNQTPGLSTQRPTHRTARLSRNMSRLQRTLVLSIAIILFVVSASDWNSHVLSELLAGNNENALWIYNVTTFSTVLACCSQRATLLRWRFLK